MKNTRPAYLFAAILAALAVCGAARAEDKNYQAEVDASGAITGWSSGSPWSGSLFTMFPFIVSETDEVGIVATGNAMAASPPPANTFSSVAILGELRIGETTGGASSTPHVNLGIMNTNVQSGGRLVVVDEATFFAVFANNGTITNTGVMNFQSSVTYSGSGAITNTGVINLDAAMVNSDMNALLGTVKNSNADFGTINVSDNLAGGSHFTGLSGSSQTGTVNFIGAVGTGVANVSNVDVGSGGDVFFKAAGNYVGTLTARTVTAEQATTFTGAVSADSLVGDGTKIFTGGTYTRSLVVGTGGVMLNDTASSVTVTGSLDASGGTVDVSDGRFTIGNVSSPVVGASTAFTIRGNGEMALYNDGVNMSGVLGYTSLSDTGTLFLSSPDPATSQYGAFALANAIADTTVHLADMKLVGTGDVKGAKIVVGSGTVDLGEDSGARGVLVTANIGPDAFTLASGATLRVSATTGANAISVGAGGGVHINGTLDLADENANLTISAASGSGAPVFGAGSALKLVAAGGVIGKLNAMGYDFTAGQVAVTVATPSGDENDALGQTFLQIDGTDATSAGATITGGANLFSPIYYITDFGQISGIKSKTTAFTDLVGPPLSQNELALAANMDAQSGPARAAVNGYLNAVSALYLGNQTAARRALGQAGLEYATILFEPLRALDRATYRLNRDRLLARLGGSALLADAGGQSLDALAALPVCGSAADRTTAWASYLGAWDKLDSEYLVAAGYKLDGNGVAAGVDHSLGRFTFGAFGAYMDADTTVRDLGTEYKSDLMNLGLFGEYRHESGVYGRAGYTYGRGWNDYDVAMFVGGRKSGSFRTSSHTVYGELGYVWRLPARFTAIPSLGVTYAHYSSGGWVESAIGNPAVYANRVDGRSDNGVDVPLQVAVNKTFDAGGAVFTAEVRAGWTYAANRVDPRVTGGMIGGSGVYTMQGVTPGRSRFTCGAGLSAAINPRVDVGASYAFEASGGYRSHSLNAGVGISF